LFCECEAKKEEEEEEERRRKESNSVFDSLQYVID
jgi:hypothetical protein